jgi:hypothetical protein
MERNSPLARSTSGLHSQRLMLSTLHPRNEQNLGLRVELANQLISLLVDIDSKPPASIFSLNSVSISVSRCGLTVSMSHSASTLSPSLQIILIVLIIGTSDKLVCARQHPWQKL